MIGMWQVNGYPTADGHAAGGFGAYELSSEVRRAAEYKLNLFGERVRVRSAGKK